MFLEKIIDKKKKYLENRKKLRPFSSFEKKSTQYSGKIFFQNLKRNSINIIAEIKKASPSQGVFFEDFDPALILKNYEEGGAAAISILTETDYFLGSPEIFAALREKTQIPLLRKDFIIDEYQIYESACLGANALLLIVRILEKKTLQDFLALTRDLGMAPLVEVHDENELETALVAGADILGVNSRNLKTFQIDLQEMKRLLSLIPEKNLRIAESGIKDKSDIAYLKEAGADAFLVGETLVKSKDPKLLLKEWTA